jgi:hypothetical protein
VDASTTTTIHGVSIFSRQRKRKADVFDIALSPEGIIVQRPGRSDQHMAWERISQWEIEERPGCVVLTLRGGGSVTPLMVKGWTLDDLETVMRQTTAATRGPAAVADAPAVAEAVADAPADEPVADAPADADAVAAEAVPPVVAAVPVVSGAAPADPAPAGATQSDAVPRAARRQASRRSERSTWKAVVTVTLLGVLAAAVVIVLLQSAGLISWSFLGPTA